MRKLRRSVAKANMKRMGIQHPNKRHYAIQHGVPVRLPSFFSQHWREYISVER